MGMVRVPSGMMISTRLPGVQTVGAALGDEWLNLSRDRFCSDARLLGVIIAIKS